MLCAQIAVSLAHATLADAARKEIGVLAKKCFAILPNPLEQFQTDRAVNESPSFFKVPSDISSNRVQRPVEARVFDRSHFMKKRKLFCDGKHEAW